MNTSTRIALILGPLILVISLLQSAGSKRHAATIENKMAESTPTHSESLTDSLNHAQSGVVHETKVNEAEVNDAKESESAHSNLPANVSNQMKGPLHERLFPKSRVISEEQFGPNDEGIITKIQLLETNFKYSMIRLEQRWKGDEPLPPVAMVANHVMIERKEGMTDSEFRKAIEGSGLTIDKMLPDTDVYIISFNTNNDVHSIDKVLEKISDRSDSLGIVEPDYIRFVN